MTAGHVGGPAASSACLSDLRFVSGILPLRAAGLPLFWAIHRLRSVILFIDSGCGLVDHCQSTGKRPKSGKETPGRGSLTTMHGPLAPLLFVMAIVFATAFLFMAVTGIMILWALPVIVLSLTFGHRRPAKPGGTPLFRAG